MTLLIDAEGPGAVAARDGLLVVSDGAVVLATTALCRLIGMSEDELVGSPPPGWIPPIAASGQDLDAALPVQNL